MTSIRALLAISIFLAGCSSVAPKQNTVAADMVLEPWAAVIANYQARDSRAVYAIDADKSQLRVMAFRGGKMAKLGHNHVLTAPTLKGMLFWPAQWKELVADVRVNLSEMQLDDPGLRKEIGGHFASPLGSSAIQGTRAHMLGEDNFQAERYPELGVRIRGAAGDLPYAVVEAEMMLHGVAKRILLPVKIDHDEARQLVKLSGSFAFRQTDFGVKPYTALNGLLAVQDEVVVEFVLVAVLALPG